MRRWLLRRRASQVRLLVLDVDGVLTEGQLYFNPQGEALKVFNTLDGHGIHMLARSGIPTAIISGRHSPCVQQRAAELGIVECHLGVREKLPVWQTILERTGCSADQAAYVGDDLPDRPCLQAAGLAIAVANAHPDLKRHAHWITSKAGGRGAVREICDMILGSRPHPLNPNIADRT